MGRALMVLGAALFVLGWVLYAAPWLVSWMGRLPGDLRIEREGLRLYAPLTTCLVLSALLWALSYLWSQLR